VQYDWDFGVVLRQYPLLLDGAISTVKLAIACFALAITAGLLMCVARMARSKVAAVPAFVYIEFFRAAPLFVLLVWFFFAFPVVSGVELSAFEAAVIATGLQSSAFFAEIFRAGIQSIARGQWEASKAVGMSYIATMRFVILPQAVRRMLPVFFTRTVELIKNTALAPVISYSEIVYATRTIGSDTFRPIESFTVLALVFFCTLFALSRVSIYFEKRSPNRER
jgi:polar amino acid transport system permease protein